MPKDLMLLDKAYKAGFKAQENAIVLQWSHGAHAEALRSTPSPEKTETSTGEFRESLRISKNKISGYKPGKKLAYSIPQPSAVDKALKRRRFGSITFLSSSVDHAGFVERKHNYKVMEKSSRAGLANMNGREAGRAAIRAALNV